MTDGEKLDLMLKLLQDCARMLRDGAYKNKSSFTETAAAKPIADDADLNSKYGDPEVRFDPKRWEGPSQKGKKFSECPADFLEKLAGFLDWAADQDESNNAMTNSGKPLAPYKRKDAARARGWMKRNAERIAADDVMF